MTNLEEGQYVSSEDGHLLAYQKEGSIDQATRIEVLNLSTGKGYQVDAGAEESIRPLGFIRNDFVFGTARSGDSGHDSVRGDCSSDVSSGDPQPKQ